MARLITAADVTRWRQEAGDGPGYLFAFGHVLTPGAIDTARSLSIEVLYPGSRTREILKRLAEEVTQGPVGDGELQQIEAQLLAKLRG